MNAMNKRWLMAMLALTAGTVISCDLTETKAEAGMNRDFTKCFPECGMAPAKEIATLTYVTGSHEHSSLGTAIYNYRTFTDSIFRVNDSVRVIVLDSSHKISDSNTYSEKRFYSKDCPLEFFSLTRNNLPDSSDFKKVVFKGDTLYAYIKNPGSQCSTVHIFWMQKYGLIYNTATSCSSHNPSGYGTHLLKVNGETFTINPDSLVYL